MSKKRIGRPKLNAADRQAVVITVRMTCQDRRVIGAAADVAGVKLSKWIRATLIGVANGDKVAGVERKAVDSNSVIGTSGDP
jgi:hypothetical protein